MLNNFILAEESSEVFVSYGKVITNKDGIIEIVGLGSVGAVNTSFVASNLGQLMADCPGKPIDVKKKISDGKLKEVILDWFRPEDYAQVPKSLYKLHDAITRSIMLNYRVHAVINDINK